MENETANKALDVIVAITDERDSWQARALAAEVELVVARRERDEAESTGKADRESLDLVEKENAELQACLVMARRD